MTFADLSVQWIVETGEMKRRELHLSETERAELQRLRASDPRPYRRERAAALLKIAAGTSAHQVARQGLLRARCPATVYGWLDHYQQHRSLKIRPACRRAFSPS